MHFLKILLYGKNCSQLVKRISKILIFEIHEALDEKILFHSFFFFLSFHKETTLYSYILFRPDPEYSFFLHKVYRLIELSF